MGNLLGGLDKKPSNWWRFSVAVLAPTIALLIKLLLAPAIKQESPFALFYAAVLVSDRYGGIRAGLLASVLPAVVRDYFFLSPKYSFIRHNWGQNLRLVIFLIESIAICEVVVSLKLAKRRVEQSKKEALQHQDISHQIDDIGLGVDTAIPCGLINNKFISNALKYNFPLGKEGKIKLDLINKQKQLFLSVSGNEIGLPEKFDIQNTELLGLKIVNALTEQLQDSIEIKQSQGTEFKIKFSV
jgi:glucose-6-phosphate-specific signal transduction histidine kinase